MLVTHINVVSWLFGHCYARIPLHQLNCLSKMFASVIIARREQSIIFPCHQQWLSCVIQSHSLTQWKPVEWPRVNFPVSATERPKYEKRRDFPNNSLKDFLHLRAVSQWLEPISNWARVHNSVWNIGIRVGRRLEHVSGKILRDVFCWGPMVA